MAHNWSMEFEAGLRDYEDAQALVVGCYFCGQEVIDGTICEACGTPTPSWLDANPDEDCPLDGDAESALASAGFGTDEDYGYYGGDEW